MSDIYEFDKTDMDKLCSGCLMYELHIEKPEHYHECEGYIEKHVNCPCQNCLVKAMCDDVCDKYKKEWGIFRYG